ncbi:MAG: hypothetical protein AABX60_00485, partial [Nanoarchaeota archaeon]
NLSGVSVHGGERRSTSVALEHIEPCQERLKKRLSLMDTALDEIKVAEKKADMLLEEAEKQKQKIMSDARLRAAQFLKDSEAELAEKKAQTIERRRGKLLAAREKILGEGVNELKSLRKNSEKRADEAIDLVLEMFEKEITQMR